MKIDDSPYILGCLKYIELFGNEDHMRFCFYCLMCFKYVMLPKPFTKRFLQFMNIYLISQKVLRKPIISLEYVFVDGDYISAIKNIEFPKH